MLKSILTIMFIGRVNTLLRGGVYAANFLLPLFFRGIVAGCQVLQVNAHF